MAKVPILRWSVAMNTTHCLHLDGLDVVVMDRRPTPRRETDPTPATAQDVLPLGTDTNATVPPTDQEHTERQAEADRLVSGLARIILEVLGRRRPASHLAARCTAPTVRAVRACADQLDWRGVRLLAARAMPLDGHAIEGHLLLVRDDHCLAVTLRLDGGPDRWRCSHVEALLPPALQAASTTTGRTTPPAGVIRQAA